MLDRLASKLLYALGQRRYAQLHARAHDPMRWQDALLRQFIDAGCDTVWGRERDYRHIDSLAAFQARQPLTRHADVVEYWNRAMAGERDVSWPGFTRYFGMSSGTTSAAGHNKYIPLTDAAIRTNKQGGFDALACYLGTTGDRALLADGGKFLFLGGSTTLTEVPSTHRPHAPSFHGDNTGIMTRLAPRLARRFTLPTHDFAFLGDWETKVERIAAQAADADVRVISGVPSWMAILFERLLAHTGKATIAEVWPNLRAFIHGGMAFAPYRALFEQLVGAPLAYLDSYTATEGGMIAIQDRAARDNGAEPDMLVLPDRGAFYEFVPVAHIDEPHPRAYTLAEAQVGEVYAIVMTTNAGLWRYVVGDTVVFTSLDPPRLRFAGRLAAFLNFFGEHVIQEELERAVAHAAKSFGVIVKDFAVAPVMPTPERATPGHRWFVEFAGDAPADLSAFASAIDSDIAATNEDYASHRAGDAGLLMPDVVVCPAATFYEWMKSRGKLGGQNKVPRVLADADLAESLAAIAGSGQ